ncbi:MAG TPA: hypothetical protein VLG71_02555, partial [Candidatus Limnocylindria bacterium]|nr:hypothetical protein [Candidatus Limnocylindria bacterium]
TIEVNAQTTSGKTALDFTRSSPQQPRLEALVLKYGGRPGPQDGFPLGYPPVVVWNTRPSALIV